MAVSSFFLKLPLLPLIEFHAAAYITMEREDVSITNVFVGLRYIRYERLEAEVQNNKTQKENWQSNMLGGV